MTKPDLSVKLEPLVSGKGTYLPLAPPTSNGQAEYKVVFRLEITNNYSDKNVEVTGIKFVFPSSSFDMKNVNAYGQMSIGPHQKAIWSNGLVDMNPDPDIADMYDNAVYLSTAPTNVTIQLKCQGFDEVFTVNWDLAPHSSPTPSGSYVFPYNVTDLKLNEFFITSAHHGSNGGASGSQIYAHDIGVVGFDLQTQQWYETFSTSNSHKEDYRIWGKPVRAMADGVVHDVRDTMDDNEIKLVNGVPQFSEKPAGAGNDWVYGNYVTIRSNNTELVKLCHLQKGKIPMPFTQIGAQVQVGDIIGYVGSSGHTTNPHTHIECSSVSGALRPFPFHNTWIVSYDKLKSASTNGLWVSLDAQGIPQESSVIYPSYVAPYLNSPIVITPGQAVDPLYLILPGNVYAKVAEWLHPHVPKVDEVRSIFRTMTNEEIRSSLSRAKSVLEYTKVIVRAAEEEMG